jgi:hypothetical protein
MSHRRHKPEGYELRLQEYMEVNLHPETAKHIGELVFHSPLGSSEFAMNIILQMQLDHLRKDTEIVEQAHHND